MVVVVVVVVAVELLVTEVAARLAKSLPAVSCNALVSSPFVGSAYATVTFAPVQIAGDKLRRAVEPEIETAVTAIDCPLARTVNALEGAVVDDNASFIVIVSVVPALFKDADTNVGATASGNE